MRIKILNFSHYVIELIIICNFLNKLLFKENSINYLIWWSCKIWFICYSLF